jgi:curved DNA-binding protein CbpA
MKDYYKILELPFGASSIEIKRAYYRLAFKYHPDKNFGNKLFEELFKEINEAYLVLSNDTKRVIYHIEYEDYLKGKIITQKPFVPADPTARSSPRGPATRIVVQYKELKMAVLIIFFVIVIVLLFQARGHMNEQTNPQVTIPPTDTSTQISRLTKNEYYEIISKEFLESGDSTLLKLDVDSMMHVMDSIMNAEKK